MYAAVVFTENLSGFKQALKERRNAEFEQTVGLNIKHKAKNRTDWSGLFGFRDPQQLSGIKRLLQDPLIADADGDRENIKHLSFKERLHDNVQQTCEYVRSGGTSGKTNSRFGGFFFF